MKNRFVCPDESAFAISDTDSHGDSYCKEGLTKREYFAAMAMQGLLSSGRRDSREYFVKASVSLADALIEELNRRQDKWKQQN